MLCSDVSIWSWSLIWGVPSSIEGYDFKITYFVMSVLHLQWSLLYYMLSLSILDLVNLKRLDVFAIGFAEEISRSVPVIIFYHNS